MSIQQLTLKSLRRRAAAQGWRVRHVRNWNRILGNDGFVVLNDWRNWVVTDDPLDEVELRDWLIDAIETKYCAS